MLLGAHNILRSCIVSAIDSRVRFMKCANPQHALLRCGLIDGKELSLSTLGKAVRMWQRKAQNLISKEILFDQNPPTAFKDICSFLQDDWTCSNATYSFFSHPSNQKEVSSFSKFVIHHIWNDSSLRASFFLQEQQQHRQPPQTRAQAHSQQPTGSVQQRQQQRFQINQTRAQKYLETCQELQEILLTLLHVTGGGTAPGTEQVYLLRNTACSRRNLFLLQGGQVVFLSRYNKTQALTGKEKIIARFPDPVTSKLFLQMILLVRPAEVWLVRQLHGVGEASHSYESYVFSDRRGPFQSHKVIQSIHSIFVKADISLSFQQYRHYQTAMAREHLSAELQKLILEQLGAGRTGHSGNISDTEECGDSGAEGDHDESNLVPLESSSQVLNNALDMSRIFPVHEQAGHTLRTADQIYGLGITDLNGLGSARLQDFHKTSKAWHRCLFLTANAFQDVDPPRSVLEKRTWNMRPPSREKEPNEDNDGNHENREGSGDKGSHITHGENNDAGLQRSAILSTKIHESMMSFFSEHAKSLSRVYKRISPSSPAPHLSKHELRRLLSHWRDMQKDPNAVFRNQEQVHAIQLMLARQFDLFLVMPTASGKTSMLLLVSFIEQEENCRNQLTLVVVPIIALIQDLTRRCRDAGICAGTWADRARVESLTMIFLTPENLETVAYAALVGEQSNKGRLARIVVEECHTTMMWNSFRPACGSLKDQLRPPGIHAQVVLLTATAPPDMMENLSSEHGVQDYMEIRQNTVRTNLSYIVRHVGARFENVEGRLCQDAAMTIRDEIARFLNPAESTPPNQPDTRAIDAEHMHNGCHRGDNTIQAQIIVYTPTRTLCEKLAAFISSRNDISFPGVEILRLHSGLPFQEKENAMNKWNKFCTENKDNMRFSLVRTATAQVQSAGGHDQQVMRCQVMVATSAFGMGVDSPFVRSVIHVGYARSLLDYAQESGRAGRDGLPAKCILLYSDQLLARERHVVTSFPSDQVLDMRRDQRHVLLGPQSSEQPDISRQMRDLNLFQSYAKSASKCRRQIIFGHMDRSEPPMCIFTEPRQQNRLVPKATPGSVSHKNSRSSPPTPSTVMFVPCIHGSIECVICNLSPLCDYCIEIQDDVPARSSKGKVQLQLTPKVCTPASETPLQPFTSPLLSSLPHDTRPIRSSSNGNWFSSNLPVFEERGSSGKATTGSEEVTPFSSRPARTTHEIRSIAHAFKQKCIDLKDYCFPCLVDKGGIKQNSTDCLEPICKRKRCFSCRQLSHQKDCCELIPFRPLPQTPRKYPPSQNERKNHCYACGLDKWMRVGLHEPSEFSRVRCCPYVVAFQLAAVAWEHPERHRQIVEKFQLDLLDSRTDLPQVLRDVFFFKWLRETNLQDGNKLNLMQIVDFLCKLA